MPSEHLKSSFRGQSLEEPRSPWLYSYSRWFGEPFCGLGFGCGVAKLKLRLTPNSLT